MDYTFCDIMGAAYNSINAFHFQVYPMHNWVGLVYLEMFYSLTIIPLILNTILLCNLLLSEMVSVHCYKNSFTCCTRE